MKLLLCPECGTEFDPANRASPNALEASVVQIVYCSDKCKKRAANKRYYRQHREQVIERSGFFIPRPARPAGLSRPE